MDTGETLVTVDFREVTGGAEIVLVHERQRDAAVAEFHADGWGRLGFPRLEEFLSGVQT